MGGEERRNRPMRRLCGGGYLWCSSWYMAANTNTVIPTFYLSYILRVVTVLDVGVLAAAAPVSA